MMKERIGKKKTQNVWNKSPEQDDRLDKRMFYQNQNNKTITIM